MRTSALTVLWVMPLLLSLAPTAQADEPTLKTDDKPCAVTPLASLDVRVDDHGTLLVPVNVAGHDAWMALLMEQGGNSILYSTAIEGWHLKREGVQPPYNWINGAPLDQVTTVDLRLGVLIFKDSRMLLLSHQAHPETAMYDGKRLIGQLTTQFIRAVDVELNLAQNKVNLFAQTTCRGGAVYWGGEYTAVPLSFERLGLLRFSMELDKEGIQTSFSTGGPGSHLSTDVTRKYFGFDESSPATQHESLTNGKESYSYRAMELSAKGLEIKNAQIQLWRTNGLCDPDRDVRYLSGIGCKNWNNVTPLSIGTDLLKRLRVYIASKEGMIYFTRIDPVAESAAPSVAEPVH